MAIVYILFSRKLDTFYIGFTCDSIENRIKKHNARHRGFTSRSSDWELVYSESYELKNDALNREKYLKKMKSRKYILDLIGLQRWYLHRLIRMTRASRFKNREGAWFDFKWARQ